MIWAAIAAMTGASIFAILRALSQVGHTGPDNSPDIALFRGQLAMIDDEALRGDLTANEAEASRAEISRRLLALTRRPQKHADRDVSLVVIDASASGGVAGADCTAGFLTDFLCHQRSAQACGKADATDIRRGA